MRRLAWRNERILYKRKCDGTGKNILSVYSPEKPFPVYDPSYWYSDAWNAQKYQRDFDFSRPFFEQFVELMNVVPQLARSVVGNENCDYVNQCGWCKDCYLIFEADHNWSCMYSGHIFDSRDCLDLLYAYNCELCYECVDCYDCYNLNFSQDCKHCSDSWFLKNCIGCSNCFGCVNLRNKQYYFMNQPLGKEAYFEKLRSISLSSHTTIQKLRRDFEIYAKKFPQKYLHGVQNEDSTGDYLSNTQRCEDCFDLVNAQDCKFVYDSRNTKMVYDMTVFGATRSVEWCLENHEIGDAVQNVAFSDQIWCNCHDIMYSKLCIQGSHHLFGCVGLKHASYCIFNKPFPPEEYERHVKRIMEHMKKTRLPNKQTQEFGEFFPVSCSPYGYNETMAQTYYPLSKEEALKAGYTWKDEEARTPMAQTFQIPDSGMEAPESICQEIFLCDAKSPDCEPCQKNFKIIPQEFSFYRRKGLPIPLICPECRHQSRMRLRNPRHLWKRSCHRCGTEFRTTYSPDRPERIYCEKCFLDNV